MPDSLPTLFLSHGAPSLELEDVPARTFLRALAGSLPRPRALVVASAHWTTAAPEVEASEHPETIHDFSGFPPELYRLRYPAPGDPALAARIRDDLTAAGFPARTTQRGLDHGVWVPLRLAYPAADIPVVAVSLQPQLGAAHHLALGRALEPLRHEGVLVIGSGSATHNLRELRWGGAGQTPAWVSAFDDWLEKASLQGDHAALVDWAAAPDALRNHPSAEHFLPLLVALGAAGPGAHGRSLHRSMTYGVLSMAAYAFA